MTQFVVAWAVVAWSCPWGLGKAPDLVKEFVCEGRRTLESVRLKDEGDVRRKLIELGPRDDVAVWAVDQNGQHHEIKFVWLPHLTGSGRR